MTPDPDSKASTLEANPDAGHENVEQSRAYRETGVYQQLMSFVNGRADVFGNVSKTLAQLGIYYRIQLRPLLGSWLRIELPRLFLFLPVLIGCGVGVYFALPSEPSLFLLVGLSSIFLAALTLLGHENPLWRILVIICLTVFVGGISAKIRVMMVDAPVLQSELDFADMKGRVVRTELHDRGWRILVEPHAIEGLQDNDLPSRVRISWKGKAFPAKVGDHIAWRVGLAPPPAPAIAGGYDFGRHLYFLKIGAVGYGVGQVEVLDNFIDETAKNAFGVRIADYIEGKRQSLFLHIQNKAPGQGGAIVAAIVTGKREAILPDSEAALRDSGLAHLLAISGLHMGLATGLIFFVVRLGLVLNTRIALNYPVKKWAAFAALLSGFLYLLISGAGWSARRAFIMSAIIFLAIIVDRKALSLRNVAIAAIIILLTTPEALVHPGFQMSFAAVTALIAFYEWSTEYRQKRLQQGLAIEKDIAIPKNFLITGFRKLRQFIVGIAITDTIAALATAPFALYHFNRAALYSLPANMLAMPLMGLWIMPSIIVALLLIPFGLDGFFWRIAAYGIDMIITIGAKISSVPGAISTIPNQSIIWLIVITVGGVLFCLLKAPWRVVGLLAIPVAAIVAFINKPPAILIDKDGRNVGMMVNRDGRDQLSVFDRRRGRFSTSVWMESLGFDAVGEKPLWMRDILPCDQHGCVTQHNGKVIAISTVPSSLHVDCNQADLVIALYPVNRRLAPACKALLLDQRGAWEGGARTVYIKRNNKIIIKKVLAPSISRPWR